MNWRVTTLSFIACSLLACLTQAQQRQIGPRVAEARPPQAQQRPKGMPNWFPLEPKLKEHTDKVLAFWEFHSSKIERYRCDFQRWEYDRKNFDPVQPQTYAKGKIKYAKPDKGLFEVTELTQNVKQPGGAIQPIKQQDSEFEKWICDGATTFEFNHRNKQLIERALPPEMQGAQIIDGPLPFLFGAKKAQIEERYWVRINASKTNVHWLEAVPKRREDAANFQMIEIVIPDDEAFLPEAIILHHRGGTQTTFQFENRETNWNQALQALAIWNREFFNPATPRGWKRVKEQIPVQQPIAQPRGQAPAARQAQQGLPNRFPR